MAPLDITAAPFNLMTCLSKGVINLAAMCRQVIIQLSPQEHQIPQVMRNIFIDMAGHLSDDEFSMLKHLMKK